MRDLIRVGLAAVALGVVTEWASIAQARPRQGTADAWTAARSMRYLRYVTETWSTGPRELIGQFERDRIDPSYDISDRYVPADAWDSSFERFANLEDLRDFRMLDLLTIYLAYPDHPALDPSLMPRVEQALLDFKFWVTDPTPEGMLDNSVYWTENHQMNYYVIEYLAGMLFPDAVFTNDGRTGAEHQARAEDALYRWFDRKGRLGFNEWHSNVYYAATLRPLLLLLDYADNPDLATRAAMVVDLLLLDLALNTHQSTFGASHGRSYKKDKTSGPLEDTWNIAKMLFATSDQPFQQKSSSAVYFARSAGYRLPKAILRIARHQGAFVDRERMGIPMNELGPYDPEPEAPYGFAFSDPGDLDVWWGMGAMIAWPVVPLTFTTLEQNDLWYTDEWVQLSGFRPLLADLVSAQFLAMMAAPAVNGNLLRQVNTYTYRDRHGMLASAVGYRQGFAGVQVHSWQATLDPDAIVFTNHPLAPLVPSDDWAEDYGYFTGEASWPRAGQHENVGVFIYAPQWYQENPPPLDAFTYQPFTHAYFPQDHFDEVEQEGGWTFGRRGTAYVALYSWRPAEFLAYDPAYFATNGMTRPFDLVAAGGADNVWIVELGNARRSGSFARFQAGILATPPAILDLGIDAETQLPLGFEVAYESPSQGHVEFGWTAPLVVNGNVIATADFPRFDNPWVQTPFESERYEISYQGCRLTLDFARGTRRAACGRGRHGRRHGR